MEQCTKCNGPIFLCNDVYDRFDHFFECNKYKSRFWMGKTVGQTRELTPEENIFIEGYINKQEG